MFKKMSKNPGKTIKNFSRIIYILQIIFSGILVLASIGLIIGGATASYYVSDYLFIGAGVCFGLAIVNAIFAIVIAMFLYGFGELVESNVVVARNTSAPVPPQPVHMPVQPQQPAGFNPTQNNPF